MITEPAQSHCVRSLVEEMPMGAFSKIRTLATRVGEAHRRAKTQRAVEALPEHIRKDIGWPH